MNINANFDRLFDLFSSDDFLARKGVSTEIPFFICHYDATEQEKADEAAHLLTAKLNASGVKTLLVDLYKVLTDILRDNDALDWILESEKSLDKKRLLSDMRALADAKLVVAPAISKMVRDGDYHIVLMTGIGACQPIVEANSLLENLQDKVTKIPLVLFFPGEYVQSSGSGSSLRLFGSHEGHGYYRAFDVETFIGVSPSIH